MVRLGMIREGDRLLAALSGGKDSWTMLHVLARLQAAAPVRFELTAVTVDPGFPGFAASAPADRCRELGVEHRVVSSGAAEALRKHGSSGSSPCALCARLRRGALYGLMRREGFTSLALGHHADDRIETLLLAGLYEGYLGSMPPVLTSDDGTCRVIRPLASVSVSDIRAAIREWNPPLLPEVCPHLGQGGGRRERIRRLLDELEEETPGVRRTLLRALGDVRRERLGMGEPLPG